MAKKVLITGCSGFLSQPLIKELENSGDYLIYGITEELDFTSTHFQVTNLDIRNRDRLFQLIKEIQPDITFHLAAISNVGFSWKNQHLTYEVNFMGSNNLMEALSLHAPNGRLLLMSSAELYGNAGKDFIDEKTPICSKNPYSLSKHAMEMAGRLYEKSHKMNVTYLRSFNFIGPGQGNKFVAADFSSQIVDIEKGKKDPIISVGNLSAQRDFSDVRDIARYLRVIAENPDRGGTYNLCSGNVYTIREILDILLSLSSKKIEVQVDSSRLRPVDIPRLGGDNSLIKNTFNLSPRYKINQTLLDILEYWRAR